MEDSGWLDPQCENKDDEDGEDVEMKFDPQAEDEDDEDSDDDGMEVFATVLANINLDHIPSFATSIRKRGKHSKKHDLALSAIDCTVTSPPLSGAYHIAFPIVFDDGVRWILKVPAEGYRDQWCDHSAHALETEARTMQLLRRKSKVPVPEVYSFDSSLDNELNCPYILMEYIDGIQAHIVWFNKNAYGPSLEQRRRRILKEIAAAIVQLNDFSYTQAGALEFDNEGNAVGVRPSEEGSSTDVKSYLRRPIDLRQPPDSNMCDGEPMDKMDQGMYKLLRLFLDWVPTYPHEQGSDFVLAHPDFNAQNILVTEEGKLLSFIDWDGVRTVPRCVGCESYPNWLTRDWDPIMYTYDHDRDEGAEPKENSPEELSHYRTLYRQFVQESLAKNTQPQKSLILQTEPGSENASQETKSQPYPSITHNSLVIDNLLIAVQDSTFTLPMMDSIFSKVQEATAAEWDTKSEKMEENGDDSPSPSNSTMNEDTPDDTKSGSLDTQSTADDSKLQIVAQDCQFNNPTLQSKSYSSSAGDKYKEYSNEGPAEYSNLTVIDVSRPGTRNFLFLGKCASWIRRMVRIFTTRGRTKAKCADRLNLCQNSKEECVFEDIRDEQHIIVYDKGGFNGNAVSEKGKNKCLASTDDSNNIAAANRNGEASEANEAELHDGDEVLPITDMDLGLKADSEFDFWKVTEALADDSLDEARMRRLKQGFFALLA